MKWRLLAVLVLGLIIVAGSVAYFEHQQGWDRRKLDNVARDIVVRGMDPRPYSSFLRGHGPSLEKYHLPVEQALGATCSLDDCMAVMCSQWQDWTDCDGYLRAGLALKRNTTNLEVLIKESKALKDPSLVSSITREDLAKMPPWIELDFLMATGHPDVALPRALQILEAIRHFKNDQQRAESSRIWIHVIPRLAEIRYLLKDYKNADTEMEGAFSSFLGPGVDLGNLDTLLKKGEQPDMNAFVQMIYAAHFAMLSAGEAHDGPAFQKWKTRGSAIAKWLAKAPIADEWHRHFLINLFDTAFDANSSITPSPAPASISAS